MSQPIDNDLKKLRWQCRRGMLELDVILIPFLEQHYSQLNQQNQHHFAQLLAEADPDLYTWIMGYGKSNNLKLQGIVEVIRDKMAIA